MRKLTAVLLTISIIFSTCNAVSATETDIDKKFDFEPVSIKTDYKTVQFENDTFFQVVSWFVQEGIKQQKFLF